MEALDAFESESILPQDDDVTPEDDFATLDDALDAEDDALDPLTIESGNDADVVIAEDDPPPLGRSWAFDFGRGSFLRRGHGPLEVRGLATLRGWIEKCLNTDQGAFAIHPPDYGVEGLYDVIGAPLNASAGADLERKIRDALLFHPRISDVTNFVRSIDEVEEAITVRFTVVTDDEELLDFDNLLLRTY